MREMKLQDLKSKTPAELTSFAEEHQVENASTMRKQELMFAILKQLATQEIDLATLSQFIGGQQIPLADAATRHIEVRANGKSVARGELVQLEEQLAVELLEVYRNDSMDAMPR